MPKRRECRWKRLRIEPTRCAAIVVSVSHQPPAFTFAMAPDAANATHQPNHPDSDKRMRTVAPKELRNLIDDPKRDLTPYIVAAEQFFELTS